MPDSYGKRQRNAQKARKSAARDERRAARKRQRADRAANASGEEPSANPEWLAAVDPSSDDETDRFSEEQAGDRPSGI
jgi:hypothetical protein